MKDEKVYLKHREFLNGGTLLGAVSANVYGTYGWMTADVQISDCNRTVTLDFTVETDDKDSVFSLQARLNKVDRLLGVLQDVRNAIVQAHADLVIDQAKKLEKKDA